MFFLHESISLQFITVRALPVQSPLRLLPGGPKTSETPDQLDGRHAMCSFITGNGPEGWVPELLRCRAPIRTVAGPGEKNDARRHPFPGPNNVACVYSNAFRFCREMRYQAMRSCTPTETYSILGTDPGTIYFAQLRGTPATLMWSLLSLVTDASTGKILEYHRLIGIRRGVDRIQSSI